MGGTRKRGGSPQKTRVGFADALVTGVSRPLTNDEHWRLYYFETHADNCEQCHTPYRVHKTGGQLCADGHELAVDVAELLFKIRSDGQVYVRSSREHQEVHIEIPAAYDHVFGLLKAVQRSGNGFLETPLSYDRHFPVQPRTATRQPTRRQGDEPIPTPHTYSTRLAAPTSPPRRHRSSHGSRSGDIKRGSFYANDLFDLQEAWAREQSSRYNHDYKYDYRQPSYSY